MDYEAEDDSWDLLARYVAEAWRGRLLSCSPDRRFVVEVLSPEETGSTVGVGFKEIRPG